MSRHKLKRRLERSEACLRQAKDILSRHHLIPIDRLLAVTLDAGDGRTVESVAFLSEMKPCYPFPQVRFRIPVRQTKEVSK